MTSGLVDAKRYVCPAFNINLTSVLFASAAQGGKSSSGMDTGMEAVPGTDTIYLNDKIENPNERPLYIESG